MEILTYKIVAKGFLRILIFIFNCRQSDLELIHEPIYLRLPICLVWCLWLLVDLFAQDMRSMNWKTYDTSSISDPMNKWNMKSGNIVIIYRNSFALVEIFHIIISWIYINDQLYFVALWLLWYRNHLLKRQKRANNFDYVTNDYIHVKSIPALIWYIDRNFI